MEMGRAGSAFLKMARRSRVRHRPCGSRGRHNKTQEEIALQRDCVPNKISPEGRRKTINGQSSGWRKAGLDIVLRDRGEVCGETKISSCGHSR